MIAFDMSVGGRVAIAFVFGWALPQISHRFVARWWLEAINAYANRRVCEIKGHIYNPGKSSFALLAGGRSAPICDRCQQRRGADGQWYRTNWDLPEYIDEPVPCPAPLNDERAQELRDAFHDGGTLGLMAAAEQQAADSPYETLNDVADALNDFRRELPSSGDGRILMKSRADGLGPFVVITRIHTARVDGEDVVVLSAVAR